MAKISTSQGDIWLRLFPESTPKTVENFVGLSERGFYDGLIFHRVIPDFMIQGGDPLGNGTGGESIWGGEFADEFVAGVSNLRGSIAMANRGANTNTSQFFINQADNTFLDFKHTVFGQVISGLSTVDKITKVDRDANDKPKKDVTMQVKVFEVAE
ncbi:MAG: peptidylprolyl isomerase [Patescibacteria group bacterium]